jgi:hypothetical protein
MITIEIPDEVMNGGRYYRRDDSRSPTGESYCVVGAVLLSGSPYISRMCCITSAYDRGDYLEALRLLREVGIEVRFT